MARTLLVGVGGCHTCEGWGPVGYDGRCPRCLVWDRPGAGRVTGRCRRCDRVTRVDYTQVCRPCLVEIRYVDEQWVLAQREQRPLPPRDLQLAFVLPELTPARMEPLTKRRSPTRRPRSGHARAVCVRVCGGRG